MPHGKGPASENDDLAARNEEGRLCWCLPHDGLGNLGSSQIYGENDKHVGLTQTHPAQQRDLKDLKGKWWVQTYRLNTTWRQGRGTSGKEIRISSSHGTSQDGRATKLWVPSLSIRLNLTSVRSCHGRRKQCTPKNHPQRGQLTSCPAGRRHFSNPNWLNRKFCWSRSHVLDSERYLKIPIVNIIMQIWGFVWKLGRP